MAGERRPDRLALDGAAAERDDRPGLLEGGEDDPLLDLAEPRLPLLTEESGDRAARDLRRDQVVGIDELGSERPRRGAAGGRLAGTHEADEDDRGGLVSGHPPSLSAPSAAAIAARPKAEAAEPAHPPRSRKHVTIPPFLDLAASREISIRRGGGNW